MPALTLSPADRRDLRGRAHHLEPVVLVGAEGLTDAVVREVDAALSAHGLIKVRMAVETRDAREAALADLCGRLGAAAVQHIGRLLVLWRPPPPKEQAPRASRGAGPKRVRVRERARQRARGPQVRNLLVLGNQRVTAGGLVKRAKPRRSSPKKLLRG